MDAVADKVFIEVWIVEDAVAEIPDESVVEELFKLCELVSTDEDADETMTEVCDEVVDSGEAVGVVEGIETLVKNDDTLDTETEKVSVVERLIDATIMLVGELSAAEFDDTEVVRVEAMLLSEDEVGLTGEIESVEAPGDGAIVDEVLSNDTVDGEIAELDEDTVAIAQTGAETTFWFSVMAAVSA
jgi:hypothetical protein